MPLETPSPFLQTPRSAARARRRLRNRRIGTAAAAVVVLAALVTTGVLLARDALSTTAGSGAAPVSDAPAAEPTTKPVPVAVEPAEPPVPSLPATLTVAAVGDMHFDRRVKELIGREGGLAPLKYVSERLAAADVVVGNLESPLSSGGSPWPNKDVHFRGDPRGIEGLAASGFTFLSLANNHILDYGAEALADTVASLDGAGIGHAGAGVDRATAWTPSVATYGDTTIAFLSFSHILPAGFIATDSTAGLAPGRTDMAAVTEAIRAAKVEHDYVIVSFHWGVEYVDDANGDQVRDGRAAVDAGADMVLSHHPHVIQGIEFYNGALIAYSLGDFVFDHYSRKTGEAFILEADLGPHGVENVRAVPVYLYSIGQPKIVTGSEATDILERLKRISGPHGTSIVIEGDVGRVLP